tara:strand:- start:4525 stop:5148 length:624 start_codon:yes stop_codon:yes gene_type:complete
MKFFKFIIVCSLLALSCSSYAAFINFTSSSVSGFANQSISGSSTPSSDGFTLTLDGNLWVAVSGSYEILSTSTLYFDMEGSGNLAEFYGIGFDNDNSVTAGTLFDLGGSENTSANIVSNYTVADGLVSYSIDVGSFFTGVFSQLVLILDADNVSGASVSFSNVEICNDTVNCESLSSPSVSVSAPGALGLLTLSCMALAVRRRRFIA